MKTIGFIYLLAVCLVRAGTLEFAESLKEVHPTLDAKTVTADFEFVNNSASTVTVTEYKPTCSCITLRIKEGKLRYAPGEKGLIRADFDLGNFSGVVEKGFALWLDNAPASKPSVNLAMRVHIPVLVELQPKSVIWDIHSKADPQTIRITMNHTKPIHITSLTSASKAFKGELKTIENGKSYELVVTPLDIQAEAFAKFVIETDCDVEKHRIQQAFAMVRSPVVRPAAATQP